MKSFARIGMAILLAIQLSACSVHPLPENATGFDTVQIVAKVRCEVRDAIRDYLVAYLLSDRNPSRRSRYEALVRELKSDEYKWAELRDLGKKYAIDADTIAVFDRYNDAAIAYEFIFNITEENRNGAGVDVLSNLSHGLLSAGASGGSSLSRNNYRTFRSADNFEKLITLFSDEYCGEGGVGRTSPRDRQVANIGYPIVGSLGLKELIGAFFDLNESGNLIGLPEAAKDEATLPTISEKMQFTTKLTGGASVGFTGDADGRRSLRLSKASISTDNSREDVHTLRIVVKLPAENAEATRTIAEQRLLSANILPLRGTSVKQLVKRVALVDLSIAPEKEYLEEKILVARNLRVLLPN